MVCLATKLQEEKNNKISLSSVYVWQHTCIISYLLAGTPVYWKHILSRLIERSFIEEYLSAQIKQ